MAQVVDANNTAGNVWAHTASHSAKKQAWLVEHALLSRISRKKTSGCPVSAPTRRANAHKAAVEPVSARQNMRMALILSTIRNVRGQVKIGLANLLYNMKLIVWLNGKDAPA